VKAPRIILALLLLAAVVFAIGGAVGLTIGFFYADWLYAQLPPVTIDAPAVGGAASAVGIVLLLVATVHVAAAAGLRRGVPGIVTSTIVLSAAMSLLAVGWAVAAAVSAASGSAPAWAMLPAAAGLTAAALAYAWVARELIRMGRPPERRT
jgi:hypothetical protein